MTTGLDEATSDAEIRGALPWVPQVPSVVSRGAAALVEIIVYLVITIAVAVAEYFVAGPFTDFGPSNWWIGFVILAAWNGWHWAGAQTPVGSYVDHYIADLDGKAACFSCLAVRQLTRFGVLFAIPFLLFDANVSLAVCLVVVTGLFIRFGPDGRAPWDLIAGTVITQSLAGESTRELPPLTKPSDLQLSGQRVAENRRARRLLQLAGVSSVFISALIVQSIFSEAWKFVSASEFEWGLLADIGWFPRRDKFDLSTLIVGTLWITGIAMLVAGPIGLGVAIYLSEYARPKVRGIVKPAIETLASIPSVVLGFFAISFISPSLLKPGGTLFGIDFGIFSLVSAGIAVGILTVPIVASISEDAMRAVPRELREASYGLGARPATTSLRVVFPAALSGISAAFIVGISRAIGETMVVFIAAGGSGGAIFEANPAEPGQTITAAMASLGAGTDSVAGSGIAFQSLYFLGALLFVITLVLNVASDAIVRRFRQVY
ncbi:MAG: phosphate transport system permease protein [Acidimicrobiales bacterium]|jgi:phosphate transport system permease protein